jgi:ABC-2 type transport system ATP-binding protein
VDALNIQHCHKTYADGTHALRDLNLTIKAGEFIALLGPNGAGKTTLIGIITSLVNKTSGKIQVFGHDIDQHWNRAKAMIGVVPQEYNFHIFESVEQIVLNQAGYYGIPRAVAKQRAEHYLKILQLWSKRTVQSRMLSGGMKRRLMIARALMHQPKLLILDEPTAGVDIEIRRQMWSFLQEINTQQDTTILLTTHYLEEAEYLCERTAIIHQGQLLEDDKTSNLLRKLNQETFVLNSAENIAALPQAHPFVMRLIDPRTMEVDLANTQNMNDLFALLSQHNIKIISLKNKSNRLESYFLNRVQESP